MKKVIYALSFFLFAGLATVSAQDAKAKSCEGKAKKACAKTCASKKASKTAMAEVDGTKVAAAMTEADIAADMDENIERKVCSTSGKTAYYMKSVCDVSGKVAWNEAAYCSKSKKFTKVAAASVEADVEGEAVNKVEVKSEKKACTKGTKVKSSCSSKKKASS